MEICAFVKIHSQLFYSKLRPHVYSKIAAEKRVKGA